jgi:hypothetical protein
LGLELRGVLFRLVIELVLSDMKHLLLISALAGSALLCGCNKQTKINTAKIEALSQQTAVFQTNQSKQLVAIQSQLTSLAPMLDAMNNSYFSKSHDDAFFYHTNTLYLLLTVGRKIESDLQVADTAREAEHSLALYYHTNETDTMYYCVNRIEAALAAQEKRMVNQINTGTALTASNLNDSLSQQLKVLAPDAVEIARREQLEAEVALMKFDLELIKARLGITNQPAARP